MSGEWSYAIIVSAGLISLSLFIFFKLWKERKERMMENERLRCDSCGAIFRQPDIYHDLYGSGKNRYFGKCPRCGGIGEFQKIGG